MQMAVHPSAIAARVATLAILSRFCVNDFYVKSFSKTQHTQFKTNLLHEQPGSNTTVGKSRSDITYATEVQENKVPYSQIDVRRRAKISA